MCIKDAKALFVEFDMTSHGIGVKLGSNKELILLKLQEVLSELNAIFPSLFALENSEAIGLF